MNPPPLWPGIADTFGRQTQKLAEKAYEATDGNPAVEAFAYAINDQGMRQVAARFDGLKDMIDRMANAPVSHAHEYLSAIRQHLAELEAEFND